MHPPTKEIMALVQDTSLPLPKVAARIDALANAALAQARLEGAKVMQSVAFSVAQHYENKGGLFIGGVISTLDPQQVINKGVK
jgi:hypothetical protein